MEDVRAYFDGSKVAKRIDYVTQKRNELFTSPEWDALMSELERNHPKQSKNKVQRSLAGF